MAKPDMLASDDRDAAKSEKLARELVAYRGLDIADGKDRLDSARHAIRFAK